MPPMDDELSENSTQLSKDKTSTASCHSFLVRPHTWQWFAQWSDPLPLPLQVFFNVKTLGINWRMHAIVKIHKRKHAQFNNYIATTL